MLMLNKMDFVMKNNFKLTLLTFISMLSACTCASTYAGIESCPPEVVHCAYISGLSDSLSDGRYIKLYNDKVGTIMICFDGTSSAFMDQQGAANYEGKNTDTYSICSDEKGKNCESIGVDTFVVSQQSGKFTAEPKYFNLDLTKLKDKYPTCDSLKNHTLKK